MDKKFILDLAINTTSPRNNKEFLWVSYSINNLNSVKYGKSYWMTLEKRCLSLFSDSGYDLQTGVWFCLISAYLYGWEGLAISSWKFADTFVTQKKCWPPITSTQTRRNIFVWYIKNVIPVIQTLADDERTYSSLKLLEDSLTLLTDIEYKLLGGNSFVISDILSELKRQKSHYFEKNKLFSKELSPHVNINDISGSKYSGLKQRCKKASICCSMISFMSGVLMTFFINCLGKPETALKLKSVIPDSFLTEMVVNYSGCSEYTPDSTDSWMQLSKKIDNFAETLKTIENNGGYITISKLKTIAYDMKNTFLAYDLPVNERISKLYNNMYVDKKDISRELAIIKHNINKLNCQVSELELKNEFLLKKKNEKFPPHVKV